MLTIIKLQKLIVSVFVIISFLSIITQSIRFDIESSHTKCVSEDINSNSMTVGHYSVVNPNEAQQQQPLPDSHKLTLRVNSVSFFYFF